MQLRKQSPNLKLFYGNLAKELTPSIQNKIQSLIEKFLAVNPEERPNIDEAIEQFEAINAQYEQHIQPIIPTSSSIEILNIDTLIAALHKAHHSYTFRELLKQPEFNSSCLLVLLKNDAASTRVKCQAIQHKVFSLNVFSQYIHSSHSLPANYFTKNLIITVLKKIKSELVPEEILGWEVQLLKLLHSIIKYRPNKYENKDIKIKFFNELPYILHTQYCNVTLAKKIARLFNKSGYPITDGALKIFLTTEYLMSNFSEESKLEITDDNTMLTTIWSLSRDVI